MMDEKKMYAVLIKCIPALAEEPNMKEANCAYKIAALFAAFTKKKIREENFQDVEMCLETAEYLLNHGDYEVRTGIENVFLFSVSQESYISCQLLDRLAPLLSREYRRQVNASGI